jgi:hypothetical protein
VAIVRSRESNSERRWKSLGVAVEAAKEGAFTLGPGEKKALQVGSTYASSKPPSHCCATFLGKPLTQGGKMRLLYIVHTI